MTPPVCPFCSSGEVSPYLRRKDGLTVYHCNSCGLGFVSMKELADVYGSLSALYEKEYYLSEGEIGYTDYDSIPLSNFLWQPAFVQLIEDIKGKSVLDIGCATGRFMELLKEKGADEVEGIEVSAYAADLAGGKGFKVHQADIIALDTESRFDIITAFDVIEHVPDLHAFFARVCDLLKPDGVFIFMTPDAGSEDALYQKESWYGFNSSLEHIYYFSVLSLTSAMEKTFGGESVLYQASAADGQGILGFIRKTPSPKDMVLKNLFLSNFSAEFINIDNVIPVCVLLLRLGDSRYFEYLEKYRSRISSMTDNPEVSFLLSSSDNSGTRVEAPDIIRSNNREVTIRPYRDGDECGIVSLFNDVFGRHMTIEEWNWKYKGQGNSKVGSIVIENKDCGIVGHYGGIYLRLVHDGNEEEGVASCDVMIHPGFRSFIRLKKAHNLFSDKLVRDSVTMIYGFPTEETLMIPADKLKLYERIETVQEAVKDTVFHNSPSRFIYRLLPMGFDDSRLDRLWRDVKSEYRLSVIRDRAYLNWRYGRNPLFRYEIWGLQKRWSGKLLAAAVLKRDDSDKLLIMDIICRKKILSGLLTKVENLACSSGKNKLSLWAPSQIRDTLETKGFALFMTGTTLPRSTHPLTLKKDEILEKFFYSAGDTDYL